MFDEAPSCFTAGVCWRESISTASTYVLPDIAIRSFGKLAGYLSREPPVSSQDRRIRSYKSTVDNTRSSLTL